jgi:o-succinylbenzoate synthase
MHITSVKILYRQLKFKFQAGTSRGKLKYKDTWYLRLYTGVELIGTGEAGPLAGLSLESVEAMPVELARVQQELKGIRLPTNMDEVIAVVSQTCRKEFPSIQFAVETALLDAMHGGRKMMFQTDFRKNEKRIPINGLVWMGDKDFMQMQIKAKIAAGYDCIKMKIGAIDFEAEIALLASIRDKYSKDKMTLRVDANGAFTANEALGKLKRLAALGLHSIEQPIKAGQVEKMAALCSQTPLPIALDEELIGIHSKEEKLALLEKIRPQYIVLKPSLIGGIASTFEWVDIAESLNIGWWMTSMLESNIGLNAICQLADYLQVVMPQGLGTGQLYLNNVDSPLTIENGEIFYDQSKEWAQL